ncbi:Protein phosphatase methylesterase 1 [Mortierella sp. 14UC]|nr:Protein phosphatase methylesterase 1 [Mortierella sp. 14UC]
MVCQDRTSLPIQHNNNDDDEPFNLALHLLGVILILAASTLGVLMPLIATKIHPSSQQRRLPAMVLTLGRQFGTGVILATALIHMLPTAMSNLSSPCLGEFFSEDYPVMGGLLVLTSSLLMHWIEFMATEFNQIRVREPMAAASSATTPGRDRARRTTGQQPGKRQPDPADVVVSRCPGHTVTVTDELECHRDHGNQDPERAPLLLPEQHSVVAAPVGQVSSSLKADPQDIHNDPHRPPITSDNSAFYGAISDMTHARPSSPAPPLQNRPRHRHDYHRHHCHHHDHNQHLDQEAVLFDSHLLGLALPSDDQKRISTYILEAGVAAHSAIVGITLGVSSGSKFTGLLIALLFHQFFEGFALGVKIADLDLEQTSTHYLLAFIFSLTTPAGILMGIAISKTYDSDSVTALWAVGVLDAISTGILLYMGYVTLLAVEFNLNSELLRQSPRVKSWCFITLWAGAAAMAMSDYEPLDWPAFFQSKRKYAIPPEIDPTNIVYTLYESNAGRKHLPVIVLVHGAGHCARSFALVAQTLFGTPALTLNARILVPDLRGHGETTSSDQTNLDLTNLAQDLETLLTCLYGDNVGRYLDKNGKFAGQGPPIIHLVGHSMGGSIVTQVAYRNRIPGIASIAVLDMLEVNAASAPGAIRHWCETRPPVCKTISQAIQWGVESGTVRNALSARVSFPGMIVYNPTALLPVPAAPNPNPDPDTLAPIMGGFTWRTDLLASEQHWVSWFQGQNQKFLTSPCPSSPPSSINTAAVSSPSLAKLLILGGYSKLDRELSDAYLQGLFKLFTMKEVGHAVQEDDPEAVAKCLVQFWQGHDHVFKPHVA